MILDNNQDKSRHGGKRPGAGRKAGSATKRTREIADKAAEDGITPLEFMLNVMRGDPPEGIEPKQLMDWMGMQFEAAKAAAPYVHPRLAAIEHTGEGGGPIDHSLTVQFL